MIKVDLPFFFFSSRRRHTRCLSDWSSDVCSSDLSAVQPAATLGDQFHQATRVPWLVTIDSILFSHLWLGAWSTLTVRSWMYHLFYLLIAIAMLGLAFRMSTSAIRILAV